MKIPTLLVAAGIVIGSLGASAASADRGDRHDRGRHMGYGHRDHGRDRHQHCRTEWRHHHRVTRCY